MVTAMPLIEDTTRTKDPLGLPWDFGEWVDPALLSEWVTIQVETIDWTNPNVLAFEQRNPQFRPKMFLTLLTYAYARGMCASEDIAEGCYNDPLLRSICATDPPSSRAIIAFRRENRGLIQWFVMEIIKQAIKHKFAAGDFLVSPGLKRFLADAAAARIDIARHMDRGARDE